MSAFKKINSGKIQHRRFASQGISVILAALCLAFASCETASTRLPFLGEPIVNGKTTTYPKIADFNFTDQDSNIVTNATFANKIYIADFIFLSCPTICPVMTGEMKKVYETYRNNDRVAFLSHTIDPERDSVARLKAYANALGVTRNWHFVTGNQDSIMHLAEKSYYSTAYPDSTSPGGFTHSGGLLLIDKDRHIRGVYNSTSPEETQRLINDVGVLLKEQF